MENVLQDSDFKELYNLIQGELFSIGFSDIVTDIDGKYGNQNYRDRCRLLLGAFSERLTTMDSDLYKKSMAEMKKIINTGDLPVGAVVYSANLDNAHASKYNLEDAPDFSALQKKIRRFQLIISGEIIG